jgi:ABC-type multidrug transport system fused ATPase/permease subunit
MLLKLFINKQNYKLFCISDLLFIFLILLLSFFSIFIEGLSISSIPLFFTSLFDNLKINNKILDFLVSRLNAINLKDLSDLMIMFLFFFFFRSLFLYFLSIVEFIFFKRLRLKLTNILINKFFDNNLISNYKESSATKIWKIELINNFSYTIFNYISLIKNFFYLAVVLFLIIFFSINDFIYFFLFLLFLLLTFYTIFKKKIISTGKNIILFTDKKNNIISNIFDGIKTITIFQKQLFFKKLFTNANIDIEKNTQKNHFIGSFPNAFFDFFTVLIISFIYFFYLKNNSSEYLIYTIGLITYGFMRIASILKILNQNFLNIKKNSYSVDVLLKELESVSSSNVKIKLAKFYERSENINIIEVKKVKFNFVSRKFIFNNLSINFKKNYFYGIFGASGSGKSTFLDIISGINNFKSGQVNIFCKRNKISYVPQECFIMQESIKNTIAFGEDEDQINLTQVKDSIVKSQISSFINKLPGKINFELYKNGTNISVGQKQRLGIARSLYFFPDLLIMDEPTSALDHDTEVSFMRILKKLKKDLTIIMTTHKLSLKKYFDKSLLIKNKKILEF